MSEPCPSSSTRPASAPGRIASPSGRSTAPSAAQAARAWNVSTRRWLAALVAVPIVLASTQPHAIGASSKPLITDVPDLLSATIVSDNPAGGGVVKFCFDRTLSQVGSDYGQNSFYVVGYDSASFEASTRSPFHSGRCVT